MPPHQNTVKTEKIIKFCDLWYLQIEYSNCCIAESKVATMDANRMIATMVAIVDSAMYVTQPVNEKYVYKIKYYKQKRRRLTLLLRKRQAS